MCSRSSQVLSLECEHGGLKSRPRSFARQPCKKHCVLFEVAPERVERGLVFAPCL